MAVTLTANGKFYQTQKALAIQANKALSSLNSLFEKVSLNVTEKFKLFDTSPNFLTYGSEEWDFHAAPDIERVHLKFMQRILGVRPETTNAAVYGELERVQLNIVRKERILKYWFKIIKSEGSLINKLFKYQIENNNNNDAMWADQVKNLLSELGFSYLWQNSNILFYPITLEGRRGTTDEFATAPFHLDLYSAALVELAKSIPVHSLILSSHLFFCLPLFLFPFTVP